MTNYACVIYVCVCIEVHTRPIGNMLESLLKQEVLMEGDGLSLGVTNSMMKFLSHEGPFIGMTMYSETSLLQTCLFQSKHGI